MKKLFCSQPKLLICIELKLAEILGVCGIVGILYGFGIIFNPIFFPYRNTTPSIFFSGFIVIWCMAILFMIGVGIYHAIKANWAWADRLSKK
ncbi:MAG TPA: hypothetical protein ENH85_07525 [Candidatus Scalindua sp.]|nr:hypothetical protein [Candidatus Scalindua sp.]